MTTPEGISLVSAILNIAVTTTKGGLDEIYHTSLEAASKGGHNDVVALLARTR
jgi:hypothetical protein